MLNEPPALCDTSYGERLKGPPLGNTSFSVKLPLLYHCFVTNLFPLKGVEPTALKFLFSPGPRVDTRCYQLFQAYSFPGPIQIQI